MAAKNRGILVGVWMTELQLSQLEYVQEPGETRSDTMRRLIEEEFCKAQDDVRGQQQDVDRIPY